MVSHGSGPVQRTITNLHTGPTISSYSVEDRQQVADLDPSMFLDFADEEEEDTPCQACGEEDNEDVLMFCDGCQKMWHTYCVGLQEVPYGAWFCENCDSQRTWPPRTSVVARAAQPARRRTRGQQRRQRSLQVSHDQSWNDVWQSVWSRLSLDLDFPYEDDETTAVYIRRHRQRNIADNRSAHDAWRSRLRVAELQGAGNRFRETEPNLSGLPRRPQSPVPQVQNPDEILAWDAFDQARATSAGPSSARRGKKRKSRSSSPAQPDSENAPSRTPVKRRRTSQSVAPASAGTRGRRSSRPESPVPRRPLMLDSVGPSFLQSLLQEVEDSSDRAGPVLNSAPFRPIRTAGSPPATEQGSPRPSSPAGSPLPSNHSSPRALSPSPPPSHRPSSPTTLSSSIQPIYPEQRGSSPPPRDLPNIDVTQQSTRPTTGNTSMNGVAQPTPRPRATRIPRVLDQTNGSNAPSPTSSRHSHNVTPIQPKELTPSTANGATRANEASPTRAAISLSAKSDIQKLVSAALKPLYNDATITKDEYTTINRDVSRMLYDRIGAFESLEDDQRSRWEKVADEEVVRAVGALRANA